MHVFPRRNLPPEAEQWGRHVDDTIRDLEGTVDRLDQYSRNAYKQVASTMEQVSNQLSAIIKTQEEQAAVQQELATQQSKINQVISKLVYPEAFGNTVTGFSTTNAFANYALVTLTVPTGYTKAVVVANASMRVMNAAGGVASGVVVAAVQSTYGPRGVDDVDGFKYMNSSSSHSTLLTGLSAGSTFTARSRISTGPAQTATADNESRITGIVLWFN